MTREEQIGVLKFIKSVAPSRPQDSSCLSRPMSTFLRISSPPLVAPPRPMTPPFFPRKPERRNGTETRLGDQATVHPGISSLGEMISAYAEPVKIDDERMDIAQESMAVIDGWSKSVFSIFHRDAHWPYYGDSYLSSWSAITPFDDAASNTRLGRIK